MDIGAIIIIMLVAIILVLTFYTIGLYNKLIDARNRVEDQFTQIEIELRKKAEYIPKLIEIINTYTKHEEKIINELTNIKTKIDKTTKLNDIIKISKQVNLSLNKIYSLKETYPELKKNKNLQSIKDNIENIEDKINYARTFYNDAVLNYNNVRCQFPSNLVAQVFKFKEIDYYK